MNNLKASLRSYSKAKVDRIITRKTRNKKDVDSLYFNIINSVPQVNLIKWTSEDIAQYKLDKNLRIFDDGYSKPVLKGENEPPSANALPGNQGTNEPEVKESEKDILKLVSSIKGEIDTSKSQLKTVDDGEKNSKKRNNKKKGGNKKKKIKNNNQDDEMQNDEKFDQDNKNIHDKNIYQENKDKNDENIDQYNENKNDENIDQNIEKTNDENINWDYDKKNDENINQGNKKKNYENVDQDNVMFFYSESFNSSIEILENVSNEPIEMTKSESHSKIGTIRCRDISDLMDNSIVEKYYERFNLSQKFLKPAIESEIKPVNVSKSSTTQDLKTEDLTISDIELLYHKYFNKCVLDAILIFTNILRITLIFNQHHTTRANELKTFQEHINVNKIHLRYRKILESHLKECFLEIISKFVYSDFEPLFHLFFLCVVSIMKILDPQKCNKGDMQKQSINLLQIILKDTKIDAKVQSLAEKMLLSKTFIRECINLISLIKDGQNNDPSLSNRLSIFFKPPVYHKKYFQTVIDALTNDSNEDLELLIDKAIFLCCKNSTSKEPSLLSIAKENVTVRTPVTSKQSTSKSDNSFQQWELATIPSGIKQPLPAINLLDGKSKGNTPIIIDPPKESLDANVLIEDFSNTLLNDTTTETAMTKFKLPERTTINQKKTVFDDSLKNQSTFVASGPPSNTVKSISSDSLKSKDITVFVENILHNEVENPVNQSRAVTVKNDTVMASKNQKKSKKKPGVVVKCFRNNCQSNASVVCGKCNFTKYCSKKCQSLDWSEGHRMKCKFLSAAKLRR